MWTMHKMKENNESNVVDLERAVVNGGENDCMISANDAVMDLEDKVSTTKYHSIFQVCSQ